MYVTQKGIRYKINNKKQIQKYDCTITNLKYTIYIPNHHILLYKRNKKKKIIINSFFIYSPTLILSLQNIKYNTLLLQNFSITKTLMISPSTKSEIFIFIVCMIKKKMFFFQSYLDRDISIAKNS